MDRRKLANTKSLHPNFSSLLNTSMKESLTRIGSMSSLCSQTSVGSKKRKSDNDEASNEINCKRKRSSSELTNVRNTRGNFHQSKNDYDDDSLGSQFKKTEVKVREKPENKEKSLLEKENTIETSQRSLSQYSNAESQKSKTSSHPIKSSPMKQNKKLSKNRSMTYIESESSEDDFFEEASTSKRQKTTEIKDRPMNKSPVSKKAVRENSPFKSPKKRKAVTHDKKNKFFQTQNNKKNLWDNANDTVGCAPAPLNKFLNECGVRLSIDDEPHSINEIPPLIREKMTNFLTLNPPRCEEIAEAWNEYIKNSANLRKALDDLVEENEEIRTITVSLVRILLQIPPLQNYMVESLLNKVMDVILTIDESDNLTKSWIFLLLQQFRFLEQIYDPSTLTRYIEDLLEIGPEWFQIEFISYIPDIVVDSEHHKMAEILCKMMESPISSKVSSSGINTLSHLTISRDYMKELRVKVLNKLRHIKHTSEVPPIVGFLTSSLDDPDVCQKVLNAICDINMECILENEQKECNVSQVLTMNILKRKLMTSRIVRDTAAAIVASRESDAKPFHFIIMLLIIRLNTLKAKNIPNVLKQHIRSGHYTTTLLATFYTAYKEIAKELQPDALRCASDLMKVKDQAINDFAIKWFRMMFISQEDDFFKQQEIMNQVLMVMGYDDKTAENAMLLLSKMMMKPEELKFLQDHCRHLRLLLDKIDDFSLKDVATLYDLLHGLCSNSEEVYNILNDDLSILMQKHLFSINSIYKCKGVLSAVMKIKCYAFKTETCQDAIQLFEKVVTSVEKCPKSKGLFYDQIGQIIQQNKNLQKEFLTYITQYFTDKFTDLYFVNFADEDKDNLEPKYRLNPEGTEGSVKFFDGLEGTIVPIMFRTLQICTRRTSEDDDLSDINALLGSEVLMPIHIDDTEPKKLNFMFHCINWFRETISAFVTSPDMRNYVIKRLEQLMELQDDLLELLTMCEHGYQPPPCYFYRQPVPPFVKVEKKVSRKGKKGAATKTDMSEDETWNKGSELYAKNPTYFRRLDTKIALLLDLQMEIGPSQAKNVITVPQVCFIVSELLMIFENEVSESFVRELIHLLPKIITKLQDLIGEERSSSQLCNKEAIKLLLQLLTMIFSWKQFQNTKFSSLLRDGLRTLIRITRNNSVIPRSCQDLVKEAYNYFHSQIDIASHISLAVAFVNICQTLMSHSKNVTKAYKSIQADMAYDFLRLDWAEDKHSSSNYKLAVSALLKNWIDNEFNPLSRVSTLIENLAAEVANAKKPDDRLPSLLSITKSNFPILFKKIFEAVIKGINNSISLQKNDSERIALWKMIMQSMTKTITVCKAMEVRQNLLLFIRYVPLIIRNFLTKGMPILEFNLKYQPDDVQAILKMVQSCTKFMHTICIWGIEKKDVAITKLVPLEKQLSEQFVFRVKGMCVLNNSKEAFWMGNLQNRNLHGEEVCSQTSMEESEVDQRSETENDEIDENDDDIDSTILDSDVDKESEISEH